MIIRKITAFLSAVCIIGSGSAFNRYVCRQHTLTARAEFHDSGELGGDLRWELDDKGVLKFSGNGELTDWPRVERDPGLYNYYKIKEVIIGEGITKVGYIDYSGYKLEKITILDPDCIICETPDNADPEESGVISKVRFKGCIYGYSGSTAQRYAEKHGFSFEAIDNIAERKAGDVNCDGEFDIADVVLLQKWLLSVPDTELADWKAVDFCDDDVLDVFDLCIMKREYLKETGSH